MKKDLVEMLLPAMKEKKERVNLIGWQHCSLETEVGPTGYAGCWHGCVK